jgi:hypothetical protein
LVIGGCAVSQVRNFYRIAFFPKVCFANLIPPVKTDGNSYVAFCFYWNFLLSIEVLKKLKNARNCFAMIINCRKAIPICVNLWTVSDNWRNLWMKTVEYFEIICSMPNGIVSKNQIEVISKQKQAQKLIRSI